MPDFELQADFDRDGRLTGTPSEYTARQTAPGAIVVANLDVDRRQLPAQVTAGSAITLDYVQPTKSAGDDELAPLQIRIVNPGAVPGSSFALRLSGIHSIRTAIYDDRGVILPNPPPLIQERPLTLPAASPLSLSLETRTYPGSPFGRAMLLNTRFQPDQEDESRFELELVSRDANQVETVHDRAWFSVAPVLFLDNGMRAIRLYICDLPDNQPSVIDVQTALRAIGGVELVTVPAEIAQGDAWLQDQFQPGITVGADGWRHAIIHLPRMRANVIQSATGQNLAQFVTSHFPSRNMGLMNDFWERQLTFSDATGQRHELRFRDCNVLADRMHRVTALLNYFNQLLGRLDRTWTPLSLSWSEARLRLPTLLPILRQKINTARQGASAEWNATLNAMQQDAQTRIRNMEQVFPLGNGQNRFILSVGNRTIDVEGDRADELFIRFNQLRSSANYGGNIEVAPPTANAPLGTIVIGNAVIGTELTGTNDFMDPDLLRFLHKQRKQPVFQVDTTWLDVGHVDEILTFVPNRTNSGAGVAAFRASSGLARQLVQAAADHYIAGLPRLHHHRLNHPPSPVLERLTHTGSSPVTRFFRGKVWTHTHRPSTGSDPLPDILEPPRIYQVLAQTLTGGNPADPFSGLSVHDMHYIPGEGADRVYPADITVLELLFAEQDDRGQSTNEFIETQFLQPLEKQVIEAFPNAQVFPMPVIFDRVPNVAAWEEDPWKFSTSAFSPNVVNLQVINGNLLIPRPYGPRMRSADAIAVLTEVLRSIPAVAGLISQLTPQFLQRNQLNKTVCWIHRQDTVYQTISPIGTIRSIYRGISTIDHVIDLFKDGFPDLSDSEIRRRILQNSSNRQNFTSTGQLRDGWRQFIIQEDKVDLFETYIQLVAASLRLTVRWIDSWYYHTHFGEIHCGTNVLRVPPATQLPHWWTVQDVA